ncbi:BlaI/MecI/CopY family transcriptional regulator [Aciduricibacillus chroicocephali]|uniref:BlaI/MecI/CopY family transcriptional regulator n=1 Tax=Aciduricibacillus chroicocephali TaxID=3054939 RepID=A0ABY9KSV4_9BACI|nr:BlaI/MecI/CopY family transcriptional regulator [Bacillaceae bacterium 44XB]
MRELPQISEAEYKVMKVIWKHEPISTPEVVELVSKEADWKPNTIQTMLARLVKKKVLKAHKEGRAYIYSSLVEEFEYIEGRSRTFLENFFGGALSSMVLNFIENDKLSKEEIAELQRILDESKEGDK